VNDSILKIKWDTGEVDINLNEFFPCNQRQLKKLVKMMDLEPETKQENVKACINYLKTASNMWYGAKRTYKRNQREQKRVIKNLDYLRKLGEST
jgi:hypothetical protein